jgi:hypothetical protein
MHKKEDGRFGAETRKGKCRVEGASAEEIYKLIKLNLYFRTIWDNSQKGWHLWNRNTKWKAPT